MPSDLTPFAALNAGDVLRLTAVPVAGGLIVEIRASPGTSIIEAISIDFQFDRTKVTLPTPRAPAVPGGVLSGFTTLANEPADSPGVIKIAAFKWPGIEMGADSLLYTITFAQLPGTDGFAGAIVPGSYLVCDSTKIPMGTLPSLNIADTTLPVVSAFSPADGTEIVSTGDNLLFTFSEAVQLGSGAIAIHKNSFDGTIVENYDPANPGTNLSVSGNILTVNPAAVLSFGTHYFVTFTAGSIKDLAGNAYAGTTSYDFTTQNIHPTLTAFVAPVGTGTEDTQAEITFAALKAEGDEADVDGTVDAFVIKAISTGSLKIGSEAGVATAWSAGTNDTVDSTHYAYWTAAENANGLLPAFTVVAKDNCGAESTTTIWATVSVTAVNDAPAGIVAISGIATQGQTLTAGNTLADVDGLGTIGYQWQAGGVDITGATGSTLVLGESQVGKAITVKAGYTDGHSTVESVSSVGTTAVANVNDLPTGGVTISGTATQGQTLTAGNTLADVDGLGTIGYQWQAGGVDITGATGSTLVLGESQVGKAITVKAGYTDGHGTVESVSSGATSAVANVNDAPTGGVTITGTATQGQTLTANTTTLADADGLGAITCQWYSAEQLVSGATGNMHTLSASDVGKAISVKVSYTDGHATVEHVDSLATLPVVGTQRGLVQDGYLSNALVWVDNSIANGVRDWTDANGNGTWDSGEGESWTLTDSTGQFTGLVGTGTIRITANPANPAGTIDISTGKAFTGNYSAPTGSTVVNPLTTLVVAAAVTALANDNTLTPEAANAAGNAAVKTALGLDSNLNLSTYDALAEAAKTGSSSADTAIALKVQSAAIQIANIMDIATGAAEGGGASTSDIAKVAADVASSLIGASPGSTINLADSAVIFGAITSGLAHVVTQPTVDTVTALATTAALVNNTIVAAAAQTGGATALASLTKMVQAQIVAQDVAQTMQANHSFVALTSDEVNTQIAAESTSVKDIFTNHAPTGDVTMTGTPTQGETLTAHHTLADFDGLGTGTISYKWQSDGVNIAGATSNTFALGEAQVGHQISVVASYTDAAGHAERVSSIVTAVANINDAPTGGVTISSTGHTLTANTSTLNDADGLGPISYQWQSGGVDVVGATGSAFTFTSSDIGKTFMVKENYIDGHGTHEYVDSSAVVAADPYAGNDGGSLSTGAVLAGVGGLGLLAWAVFL